MKLHLSTCCTFTYSAIVALVLACSACGGGGGADNPVPPPPADKVSSQNSEPEIGGSPDLQAIAGELYSFQPMYSDPDNNPLIFRSSGLPSWLNLDTKTGHLAGIPAVTDTGTAHSIHIWVSDGQIETPLPPFSITVKPAHTGSATLSWTPPVARADGSTLAMSEIAGYTINYGTTSGSYPNVLDIEGATTTSVTIDELRIGTYYMVVSTRDTDGRQSGFSKEVAKVVHPNP